MTYCLFVESSNFFLRSGLALDGCILSSTNKKMKLPSFHYFLLDNSDLSLTYIIVKIFFLLFNNLKWSISFSFFFFNLPMCSSGLGVVFVCQVAKMEPPKTRGEYVW